MVYQSHSRQLRPTDSRTQTLCAGQLGWRPPGVLGQLRSEGAGSRPARNSGPSATASCGARWRLRTVRVGVSERSHAARPTPPVAVAPRLGSGLRGACGRARVPSAGYAARQPLGPGMLGTVR